MVVRDRCAITDKQIDNFRMLIDNPVSQRLLGCDRHKRAGRGGLVILDQGLVGHDDLYCFCPCKRNLFRALVERFEKPARVSLELLKLDHPLWKVAEELAKLLGRNCLKLVPLTAEQVVKQVRPRQKPVYQWAFDNSDGECRPAWGKIEAFVKYEKYPWYAKGDARIPRPIQPRHKFYRSFLAKYMRPIEGDMKTWVLPGQHYPFMAKGMDMGGLARLFMNKWRCFNCPVALSLDQTKFDGHINKWLRKLENLVFKQMSADPSYRRMLKIQETDYSYVLMGRLDGKKTYQKVRSGRCSGDPQTGCGNTVLMAMLCAIIFDVRVEVFANGDDTIVLMDQQQLKYCLTRIELFSVFGLECRVEQIAYNPYDVEWCQCYLTDTVYGDSWVRNPWRVLDTIFANPDYTRKNWRKLLKGIALCEAHQNPGIPILSPILEEICGWNVRASYKTARVVDTIYRFFDNQTDRPLVFGVTLAKRTWFAVKFGISPAEQIHLENRAISAIRKLSWARLQDREWFKNEHPVGFGLAFHEV